MVTRHAACAWPKGQAGHRASVALHCAIYGIYGCGLRRQLSFFGLIRIQAPAARCSDQSKSSSSLSEAEALVWVGVTWKAFALASREKDQTNICPHKLNHECSSATTILQTVKAFCQCILVARSQWQQDLSSWTRNVPTSIPARS